MSVYSPKSFKEKRLESCIRVKQTIEGRIDIVNVTSHDSMFITHA